MNIFFSTGNLIQEKVGCYRRRKSVTETRVGKLQDVGLLRNPKNNNIRGPSK